MRGEERRIERRREVVCGLTAVGATEEAAAARAAAEPGRQGRTLLPVSPQLNVFSSDIWPGRRMRRVCAGT
jgi:hypothetical protein